MIIGLDKSGKRVNFKDAKSSSKYFCPCCGKDITIKEDGFEHKCEEDDNTYDESDWHNLIQSYFDFENQEIGIRDVNNKYFRADVLVDNLVIQIRNDFEDVEIFNETNKFLKEMGYDVIWLFNISHYKDADKIRLIEDDKYKASMPIKCLVQNKYKVPIFFCFRGDDEDDFYCTYVEWVSCRGDYFSMNDISCSFKLEKGLDITLFSMRYKDFLQRALRGYNCTEKYKGRGLKGYSFNKYKCPKTGKFMSDEDCIGCKNCIAVECQRQSNWVVVHCNGDMECAKEREKDMPELFFTSNIRSKK